MTMKRMSSATRFTVTITVAGLLCMGADSEASTIHVPADQPTIQLAIDNATHGDSILVDSGSYLGVLDFGGKAIKLIGAGADKTTVLRTNPSVVGLNMSSITVPGAEVAGIKFTVRGRGPSILIVGSTGVTIRDNIIHNTMDNGLPSVNFMNSDGIISGNLFYEVDGSGIGLQVGTSGVIVVNNTMDRNTHGFEIRGTQVVAFNNIITNSTGSAFRIIDTANFAKLDYNVIWNNSPNYDSAIVPGDNDIAQNPNYVDASLGDYSLLVGSPAVDAGDPNPAYNDEDSTRNDIGAFTGVSLSCCVVAGDANEDGGISIGDVTALIGMIFASGSLPSCAGQADADGSDSLTIGDVTFVITHIFAGGASPICI